MHYAEVSHNTDTEAPGCTGSQAPIINLTQDGWRAEWRLQGEQRTTCWLCSHTHLRRESQHCVSYALLWFSLGDHRQTLHSLGVYRFTSYSIRINCLWYAHPSGLEKVEECLIRLSIAILVFRPFSRKEVLEMLNDSDINICLTAHVQPHATDVAMCRSQTNKTCNNVSNPS